MKKSAFASALSSARRPLQIIDENANTSDSSYPETKSKNQYKNNKHQRDYKEKERAYVIEKDESEHESTKISEENDYYHESDSDLNYYNSQNQNEESEVNFFMLILAFRCKKCKTLFSSNNRLHKHLREATCMKKSLKLKIKHERVTAHLIMNISIIESTVDFSKNIDIDFEFRE
jgi:hypothetical protein